MNVSDTLAAWRTRRPAIEPRKAHLRSDGWVQYWFRSYNGSASPGAQFAVVVSIFVNPSQFNDPSDLERYPRPIHQELLYCRAWVLTRSSSPACGNWLRSTAAAESAGCARVGCASVPDALHPHCE